MLSAVPTTFLGTLSRTFSRRLSKTSLKMSRPLKEIYPWTKSPLITSAPMRLIALAELSVEVSKAGGIGFIGSGNDQSNLEEELAKAVDLCQRAGLPTTPLPVGVGFLNWGANLEKSLQCIEKYRPCAVWLFAPGDVENLATWTLRCREVTDGVTQVWIQVGGIVEAKSVVKTCLPDVLVVQGGDAGGHGLNKAASIITLVPEVADALQNLNTQGEIKTFPSIIAAGGIVDGRGVAAAVTLGAKGVCIGTRFLSAHEAVIAKGYRNEVLRASDGGQTTVRSSVYDRLRGITAWPAPYGGRGVINQSYHDAVAGVDWDENTKKYEEAVKIGDAGWGVQGRMTTYAGTGVGLVTKEQSASEIVEEVRAEYARIFEQLTTLTDT
jgi:nitronate monooxygenase